MRPVNLAVTHTVLALAALATFSEPSFAAPPPSTASASASDSSWVAGPHVGYNWQSGTTVYGLETDFSFMGLNSRASAGVSCPLEACSTKSAIDWYGKPALLYDLKCAGSQAYLRLATEVIRRERQLVDA